jgi:hypothetical protein
MSRRFAGGQSHRSGSHHQSPSPPPRRPCHRDGGHQVVVERLVEKSMAGIAYPLLSHMNYTEWSTVMHVNLQAVGLWEAIRYGGVEF